MKVSCIVVSYYLGGLSWCILDVVSLGPLYHVFEPLLACAFFQSLFGLKYITFVGAVKRLSPDWELLSVALMYM